MATIPKPRRKQFFHLAAIATLMAAAGETMAQQGAAPPDFSGLWSHPYLPGFEPPASGPGPVTNRSRLRGGPQPAVSNPSQFLGDYTNPILQPWAADVLKKRGEAEIAGAHSPTQYNQCWLQGVPFSFFNLGMRMLQTPDKIVILYFSNNQFRQVRMNQQHPANLKPSWQGDSIGRYEGDSLIIDTIGIKADRPYAMGRYVWDAAYRGAACGGTLSAPRLRSCETSAGPE